MQDIRSRNRAATRRAVLDAAWELAEQSGIAGISMRDLAKAVGMQAPSLYTYFPSKDAIYDAMFAESYTAMADRFRGFEAEVDGLDRQAKLTRAAESFVEFCQASQPRYQLMFTRAIPGWEPSPEAYAVSVAGYEESAAQLARIGIAGETERDLYVAIVAGLAAQQMANEPQGDRWRRLCGEAMQMLIEHIERKEESGTP